MALVFLLGLSLLLTQPFFGQDIEQGRALTIVDNQGTLLYRYRESLSGSHRETLPLSAYPKALVDLVVKVEDKYFYLHPGFNPLSLLRAAYQTLRNARIVSGGSTITMQLARINGRAWMPASPWLRKLCEIAVSLRLETLYSKNEILAAYLNQVPMPGNNTGLASAARRLFGRPMRLLTTSEMAVLVAAIRSPHAQLSSLAERSYGVHRQLPLIKPAYSFNKAGDQKNYGDKGRITQAAQRLVRCRSGCASGYVSQKVYAPHYVDWLQKSILGPKAVSGLVQTKIQASLNNDIQEIITNELAGLQDNNVQHAAVVVLLLKDDHIELAALVGSANYGRNTDGQNNGATSIRNAGSSLKPFIYAQAMEQLDLKPYSKVQDRPETFSTSQIGEVFLPKNYDLNYWGDITLAEALATSRNIPAVYLLQEIGVAQFFGSLNQLGINHLRKERPETYGPGLALGAGGTRLLELTYAYSVFANMGRLYPMLIGKADGKNLYLNRTKPKQIFQAKSAGYITEILMNDELRRKAFGSPNFLEFPFDVAAKTGTSKDYRDAWTVGFSSKWIVGVWTGNFSSEPMRGVSGAFGAGRIFQQVMRHLPAHPIETHTSANPHTGICYKSGLTAAKSCPTFHFRLSREDLPPAKCNGQHHLESSNQVTSVEATNSSVDDQTTEQTALTDHLYIPKIKSPKQGEIFVLDHASGMNFQEVPLWFDQGYAGANKKSSYRINSGAWKPVPAEFQTTVALGPGLHSLEVKSANAIQRVEFEVQ